MTATWHPPLFDLKKGVFDVLRKWVPSRYTSNHYQHKTARYTATKLTHVYTETNERNAMVLYMIKQNRGAVLGALPDVPFWFVGGRGCKGLVQLWGESALWRVWMGWDCLGDGGGGGVADIEKFSWSDVKWSAATWLFKASKKRLAAFNLSIDTTLL